MFPMAKDAHLVESTIPKSVQQIIFGILDRPWHLKDVYDGRSVVLQTKAHGVDELVYRLLNLKWNVERDPEYEGTTTITIRPF